jgi:hypothetical protein
MSHISDKKATELFAIRNILTSKCGKVLDFELIGTLTKLLYHEIHHGSTSWAFGHPKSFDVDKYYKE